MTITLKPRFKNSDRGQLVALVLLTLTWLAAAVIGAVLAIFSPLVFDGAGNLRNPLAWLGFVLGALFWVVCVLSPLVGWIQWRKGRRTETWAAMAAPVAWGAATLTVLQLLPTR
ncbi:hypothetical protein [Caulobacter sp.]|uniref:hypothetical protein n=1 Tax=Caulobacter sp. TaxID=78 RepID=UPI003BA859ED